MTKPEWPEGDYPAPLLMGLCGKVSGRKLRLCAAACCRRILRLLPGEAGGLAIEVAELYADGAARRADLARVHSGFSSLPIPTGIYRREAETQATRALHFATHPTRRQYAGSVADAAAAAATYGALADVSRSDWGLYHSAHDAERAAQKGILRDILRHPFEPLPPVAAAWLACNGGIVTKLARAAYDGRSLPAGTLDQTRLVLLADALEEAGCTDGEILNHCRKPGPHYRGCWVIDLLLGKA
jgi:hypothetical protein